MEERDLADWEVLPGLPPYGAPALPFSAAGRAPLDGDWHSFAVDLTSREVTGGSYDGPDM
jgi:hypothetical protein